ncbi:polysaccharide biosynthesis/export family protein [Aestuariibacter salexigens]|uniref:polysaccharide biosynthesis/export family protein n=1 Tax=Aestuariibacter salexigens TaxID=226010 RepID=UPI0004136F0E|nr:polysaccharide biosynthesis/export family protein [Aestuariibacter salexigens]
MKRAIILTQQCMMRASLLFTLIASCGQSVFAQSAQDAINQLQFRAQQQQSPVITNSALESRSLSPQSLPAVQQQSVGQYTQAPRNGLLLPGELNARDLLPVIDSSAPAPYGATLFAGGYESERTSQINDNYMIAPGDKLSVWLWGGINFSDVLTVDNQGNVFIPNIGPIAVQDTPASGISALITSKIRQTYNDSVNIYVNLLNATPVNVFVAGPVIRPGQYAGMANDSLLYYLKRAGGIDFDRGSFRNIKVMRDGQAILNVDLYEFMQSGSMPDIVFKDEDVVLVTPLGPTVTVIDGARNSFRFELIENATTGEQLSTYAIPLPNMSHVGVIGNRKDGPFSVYMPIDRFSQFALQNGDKINYTDDWDADVYDIKISGSHLGPSYYTVTKSTRLHDLLDHIEVDPALADIDNIYLLRKSVADQQKELITQSLDRLERSVYTAPIQSTGEGAIRAEEAQLVSAFVQRAKQVEPLGRVVISDNGAVANILLEQNDEIVIPLKTDLVQIGGEVLMPQAVVYNPNADLEDYVAWAGGFSERADHQRIIIIKANGLVTFVEHSAGYWLDSDESHNIVPGDQILVLPRIDDKALQAIKDITQIIYQIAVAANVVLD